MMHGTYVGSRPDLLGKTALLRDGENGNFLAQFDDYDTPGRLAFNWHEFPQSDWSIDVQD